MTAPLPQILESELLYVQPRCQNLCKTLELEPMYSFGAGTFVQCKTLEAGALYNLGARAYVLPWRQNQCTTRTHVQSVMKYTTLDTRLLSVYFKFYLIEAKKILNSIYINTFWSSKIQYDRLFPFNNEFCSSRCSSEEKKKVWKQPFLLHLALYLICESKSHLLSSRQVRIILLSKWSLYLFYRFI